MHSLRNVITAALLALGIGGALAPASGRAEDSPVLLKLKDVLTAGQLQRIERERDRIETGARALKFTFEAVTNYGNVTVYYPVETVEEDGRVVRRAAKHPSAVVYVVLIGRYSEIRRHLNDHELADVLLQIKKVEDKGATVRTIKIRRGLFDVGRGTPADFLKDRDACYDARNGEPFFGAWPKRFRPPVGKLTTSVVHTTVVRSPLPSDRKEIIEARQFFGYVFPMLDKLLSEPQKTKIADELARSNVTDGVARVEVGELKDVGHATLHYLVTDGKPLPRPTALSTSVRLTPEQIRDDPLILRKHLAPKGAKHLLRKVRDGETRTRTLKAVEIRKVYLDLHDKNTPDGKAAVAAFRKDMDHRCTRDGLVLPEKWPAELRKPDGTFDIELTFTRLIWRKERRS